MALLDNCEAVWELEEASGTRVDAHGSNDLSDNNTVTQATGKVGDAAQFTVANTEYLSIADNASLSTGDIDFTIAAWVYLDSKSTFRAIAAKYGGAVNVDREFLLIYDSGADRFRFDFIGPSSSNQVTADALGSPSTATWYYVIGWHNASADTINIQVNDGTVNSQAWTGGGIDGTGRFTIGSWDGSNGADPQFTFDGRIDQVVVWKRVLTSQERTDMYNGGAGLSYAAMGGEAPAAGAIVFNLNIG